jgi:hypothetical protein
LAFHSSRCRAKWVAIWPGRESHPVLSSFHDKGWIRRHPHGRDQNDFSAEIGSCPTSWNTGRKSQRTRNSCQRRHRQHATKFGPIERPCGVSRRHSPITSGTVRSVVDERYANEGSCLLWVIRGHWAVPARCPLCPRKRTWSEHGRAATSSAIRTSFSVIIGLCFRETGFCDPETAASKRPLTFN